jgi:hypothetical protein
MSCGDKKGSFKHIGALLASENAQSLDDLSRLMGRLHGPGHRHSGSVPARASLSGPRARYE